MPTSEANEKRTGTVGTVTLMRKKGPRVKDIRLILNRRGEVVKMYAEGYEIGIVLTDPKSRTICFPVAALAVYAKYDTLCTPQGPCKPGWRWVFIPPSSYMCQKCP